jgi:hypothetical protein
MKLSLEDWAHRADCYAEEGAKFHHELEEAKAECGSELDNHPDDYAHNCAVGVAIKMIKAGNLFKAVDFYNLWAKFAGYAPITVLNDNPPVIDIVDAVVEVNGEDMEILLCR